MTPQERAIGRIVEAINDWLRAAGSTTRVSARDITMTQRGGVVFIAFPAAEVKRGRAR